MIKIIFLSFFLLATVIALIYMIITTVKRGKNKESRENNSSGSRDKTMTELLPFTDDVYDELHDCYTFRDGTCMDFLQIAAKDLRNMSDDEIIYDKLRFAKLYKKYAGDLKIIAINFPSETSEQQRYLMQKQKATKNEIYKEWLQKKIDELEWIRNNRTSREFFLMFWGKDAEDIIKSRDEILDCLGNGKTSLAYEIDQEKKLAVVRKLNNKNLFAV